ncbi:MAG TPA: FHA domain-containing protein [Polyangiales bacterium]
MCHRPASAARSLDEQAGRNVSELERRLAQARHFAVHVEKRVLDSAYAERISIGRARNKDLVLRHPSVSKFHAWFELGADGSLCVADAGGKNGTQLGSRVLPAREPVSVAPGEVLRFGTVDSVLCAAETLWQLIARRA